MVGFIISAIKIIFLLGFLILIHEGGHFIVAKLCKVKVNQFAIGFGPQIFSKQGKETKYALRLIPLGGFVSMEGEEQASEAEGAFNKASIPKRIAIVAAGALVNIVFGLIVYFIIVVILSGNFMAAIKATGNFSFALIESIKMLFTGGVGLDDLTGPVGISSLVSRNIRNYGIFIYAIYDISITWNYKFTTYTCSRWRKNFIINCRSNTKKAIKRKYRNSNSTFRIFNTYCTINICNIQ